MRVEKDIVVNAPVARVYELWTDFENFPRFMDHVEAVQRTGDKSLHWKAKLGPRTVEWDAEIRALVPNRTVTWHSTSGADNAGAVTLAEKGHITEMHVVIEYAPSLLESIAELVTHELSRSVEGDLDRFKALAEHSVTTAMDASNNTGLTTDAMASDSMDQDWQASTGPGAGAEWDSTPTAMSGSLGDPGAADLQRGTELDGMTIEPEHDETGGTNSASALEADALGDNPADADQARLGRVEIEGLGSDESPGQAVGSTSPEEIAAARAALGGDTADTTSAGMTSGSGARDDSMESEGGSAASQQGGEGTSAQQAWDGAASGGGAGSQNLPAGGDFLSNAAEDSGPPEQGDAVPDTALAARAAEANNRAGESAPLPGGGVASAAPGSMGGTPANDPTGGTGSVTTGTGPMGPSLMTYEAGTNPNAMPGGAGQDAASAESRANATMREVAPMAASVLGVDTASENPTTSDATTGGATPVETSARMSTTAVGGATTSSRDVPVSSSTSEDTMESTGAGHMAGVGGAPGDTGLTPPSSGSMGPSLMTYEAGTAPPADTATGGSTASGTTSADASDLGGSDLGSLTHDRTNVGSTTVSSGSLTTSGRAQPSGGLSNEAGMTTESTRSLAGSGKLGGGPATTGGPAAIPDMGNTPHGGGTGRGEGDAYGSEVVSSGGSQSYAMPMPVEGASGGMMGDSAPTTDADQPPGAMTSTGMPSAAMPMSAEGASNDTMDHNAPKTDADQTPGATDSAAMTPDTPATDVASGGTGANYSGGTGGWGTETPDSPGAQGWTPSPDDHNGGGETH